MKQILRMGAVALGLATVALSQNFAALEPRATAGPISEYAAPVRPNLPPFSSRMSAPAPSTPLEESAYVDSIRKAFGGVSYEQWDKAATEGLLNYGYFSSGKCQAALLLHEVFRRADKEEAQAHGSFFKKMDDWQRLFPQSVARRIVNVQLLDHRSDEIVNQYAGTKVPETAWEWSIRYHAQALEESRALIADGIQHPALAAVLVILSNAQPPYGGEGIELIAKALDQDPLYPQLYEALVVWAKKDEQLRKAYETAVALSWTRLGHIAFFKFYLSLEEMDLVDPLYRKYPWEEVRQGFEEYVQMFPEDCHAVNVMAKVASQLQQLETVRYSFKRQCGVDTDVWFPGRYAAWRRWALEAGPLPETRPIHEAAKQNDVPALVKLLEQGESWQAPDEDGDTPLTVAVSAGAHDVVKLLLERGADPNTADERGIPLLVCLVEKPQAELLKLFLTFKANPNLVGADDGWGALLMAAHRGRSDLMALLLAAPGIDVNLCGDKCGRPLNEAIWRGDMACVKLLVEHGADLRTGGRPSYYPPIVVAAENGHANLVRYLLEKGASTEDSEEKTHWTALMAAVDKDQADVIDLLLNAGAAVNASQHDGWTALHMAVANGNLKLLQQLVASGGNVNVQTDSGRTLLHQAIKSDHPEIVRYLLEEGVDETLTDKEGRTALAYATELKRTEIVALLSNQQ